MNKRIIMFCALTCSALGGYVPVIFGDAELFDGWSVLGGLIGGLIGVWLGVYVSKRWG